MAISFSQIDIVADVSKDIQRMVNSAEFYEKVVKEAAKIHVEDARQKTANAKSPSGGNFQQLSSGHKSDKKKRGANQIPDLRYGYVNQTRNSKPKSMESIYIEEGDPNRGAAIRFDKVADRRPATKNSSARGYMAYHQKGDAKNPQRKIYPEEDDMRSPAQSRTKSRVGGTLQFYLMTPRTITIG